MRNCLLLIICTVFICACETEGFDPVPKEAVFETTFLVDGEETNIQAGLEGYVMNTGFAENISGSYDYFSQFSSVQAGQKELNFYFDDLPILNSIQEIRANVSSDLNYALNFTGVEGIMLVPDLTSLNSTYQSEWSVASLNNTTDDNTLIPLPFLRDVKNIPVQYNLEVSNG